MKSREQRKKERLKKKKERKEIRAKKREEKKQRKLEKKRNRKDHGILWKIGAMLIGNIGLIVLFGVMVYLLYIWYPFYGVYNYIMNLITGDRYYLYDFIYNILIPYSLIISIFIIIISVLYFSMRHFLFPALYLDTEEGRGESDRKKIGRVYYLDRLKNQVYANIGKRLSILRPSKSLSKIRMGEGVRYFRDGMDFVVVADGVYHIKDDKYEFYKGAIPTQDIRDEIIEKLIDESQAKVGYRTMKSMHYNSELNKSKYTSVIALWPSWVLEEKNTAPEETYKGVVQTLQNNINSFNQIYEESLHNSEDRQRIAENLAPLAIQIYRDSTALEQYFSELKKKNEAYKEKIEMINKALKETGGKEIYYKVDLDTMIDYVRSVEAVIIDAVDKGVIEE